MPSNAMHNARVSPENEMRVSRSVRTPCKAVVTTELYAKAMLIRSVEQRLLELFAQGKLFGTVHTCIGQGWLQGGGGGSSTRRRLTV